MRPESKCQQHILVHQVQRSVNTWSQYKEDLYCEWSPNEKVATEVASRCIYCGNKSDVLYEACGI